MAKVLMVAEKPSIANAIADALSGGHSRHHSSKLPVWEYDSTFQGKPATFLVTSVAGHIFSCDFPSEYQNWDAVDPGQLYDAPTVRKVEAQGVVHHLQDWAKGCKYLVLWLDCDREGENICFEVIDVVKGKMSPPPGNQQYIYRAKFSAIAKPDIQQAMQTLGEPNENEAAAVDARQELDLKVGVSFSRLQTRYFQGKYGNLDSTLISYGPCQTPTLGFCVQRADEIAIFQPQDFWRVEVLIEAGGRDIALEHDRGRIFDIETARLFETLVSEAGVLSITGVKESEVKKGRPAGMNTAEMMKQASKGLGMSPHHAMQIAERLYLSGYISYPRTETTAYPASFDIWGTVSEQTRSPVWGSFAAGLLSAAGGMTRPKGGEDKGDHPPITPIRSATEAELGGESYRLYELIARHFLATVSPDAVYLATKVTFSAGSEVFEVSGRQMLEPGFTAILTHSAGEDVILPQFNEGQKMMPKCVKLKAGATSPPPLLTESELIELMEKHGIGTDASMAVHINNICTRNYVVLGAGRTLAPTELGRSLVHGYHRIDSELVHPAVRSSIEANCALIAAGKARKADVVAHALAVFAGKFAYFVSHIGLMDSLFEASFSPLAATGKPLSKCGKCKRYMRYIQLRPQRLYCPTCAETYNLPQNGTIKLYKELKCPLDGFELLVFSLGNSAGAVGKTYPLCPSCYNHPPNDLLGSASLGGGMSCHQCLHPTCTHSQIANAVCPCPGEAVLGVTAPAARDRTSAGRGRHGAGAGGRGRGGGSGSGGAQPRREEGSDGESDGGGGGGVGCRGVLVLDKESKPNWKMCCNSCALIVRFHGDIHQIKLDQEDRCDNCGSARLTLVAVKDKTLPIGVPETTGCVLCDEALSSLTELKLSRNKHIALRSGGKGRGRGRGRGRGGKGAAANPLMSFEDF